MFFSTPEKFKSFENNFSKIDFPLMGLLRDDDGVLLSPFYPIILADATSAPSVLKIMLPDFFGSTVVLPIMVPLIENGTVRQKSIDNILDHFFTVYNRTYNEDIREAFENGSLDSVSGVNELISKLVDYSIKEIVLRIKPRLDIDGNELTNKVVNYSELDGQALIYHSTTLAVLGVLGKSGVAVINGDTLVINDFAPDEYLETTFGIGE